MSLMHPFRLRAQAFLVLLVATVMLLPASLLAQSGDETGLTGDPLVDSILQAPGPDFLDRGYRRDDPRMWSQPPRGRWDDEPRESAREWWDEPSDPDEDWRRAEDNLAEPGQDPAPARQARREPPPPPVQRGDGPLDIVILDAEPSGPRITDAPADEPAEPPAAEVAAPTVEPDGADGRTTEAEEPYREPGGTDADVQAPDRVAAVTPPAAARAPAATEPTAPQSGPELNRMIGQMIMVGFPGQTPGDDGVRRVAEQLEAGKIGGVILMSRNIESPAQVKQLTQAFARSGEGQPTPFIAVDQEGGYVQRLSRVKGFKTHPSAERLGERNNPEAAYSAYRNLALELREFGFNLNLGPVVDLNLNPSNPVIGRLRRSYGRDPDHVTAYAKAFIYAHNESGVLTAAKHFPGHGSSDTDSHDVLVDLSNTWQEAELRPYRMLIEDNAVDMIMVGHLYHPAFSDTPDTPATLAPRAIAQVLRESLNYDGVVITDDLDMRGVRQNTSFEQRIIGAVAAGNDIVLITNGNGYQPDLPDRVADVIRTAVADGRLSEERIRTSYQRIMSLKDKLARLQRTATSAGEDRGLVDHTSGG